MKTNKSFTKRLKVTKNGKILRRTAGGNHFNAKERRAKQLNKKRSVSFTMTTKEIGRFLPN